MLYGDVNPAGRLLREKGGHDCHSEFAPFGFLLWSRKGRSGSSAVGGGRRTETHTKTIDTPKRPRGDKGKQQPLS